MKQIQNSARLVLGVFFGLVGIIGLVLPVLPGMPFLLLAAACFNGLDAETNASSATDEPNLGTQLQD